MLRSGLIATKIGNSSYYHEDGKNTHVTVLKIDECIVANVKTFEKDGYNAVQLTSIETQKDISHINKPTLIIVTKSQSNKDIEKVVEAGNKCLGENYVDEAIKSLQYHLLT